MSSDDPRGGPGTDLRASDAERDLVAAELGQHYQAGRLDQAEFDQRIGAALSARTQRDLTVLLADLPPDLPRAGTTAVTARPAGPVRWLPLVPLLFAAIVAAGFAAGGGWPGGHHWGGGPWPLLWLIPAALIFGRRWTRGPGR
jgi:hypothetical protein